ncbi:MAG: hypothetical protein ABFS18_11760 [Thermodesulfobacteriota bacterium]
MNLPKNRWLAFASHFGISLLIFLALLLIIVFFWYPGALFAAAGGWQGIRIVVGVDLVLGPLLTLIVYDIAKPRKVLFRDLLVIVLIQFSCLVGGVYVVFDERPVTVTYVHDKFYVLKNSDFIKSGTDPKTLGLNLMTPKIFYTELTQLSDESGVEAEVIVGLYNFTGNDLAYRTDLYVPFPKTSKEAAVVFRGNKLPQYQEHSADCVTVELVSAFGGGIVCFGVEAQSLEDFVSLTALQARQDPGN